VTLAAAPLPSDDEVAELASAVWQLQQHATRVLADCDEARRLLAIALHARDAQRRAQGAP